MRAASGPGLPLVARIASHGDRPAIVDKAGTHDHATLDAASAGVAARLQAAAGIDDLAGARVALMAAPGLDYAAGLLGAWRAGGLAVPLCLTHPDPELAFALDDAQATLVLADATHATRLAPLAEAAGARFLTLDPAGEPDAEPGALPRVEPARDALLLYTSGTTSRPKGVVLTHANLEAQVRSLVRAWGWTADDRLLHVLPLHHTHGIVNGLLCALWAGATCDMLSGFDAGAVWRRLAAEPTTLFMAVPTIYARLVAAWDGTPPDERQAWSEGAAGLRLMVSGSAALPVPLFERWISITGHALLERYGMTEIGMALSNPLHGERRPGTVGRPLPGVEARLVDEGGRPIDDEGRPGEIEVRGPTVFREYWRRPVETAAAFRDGWFQTGDEALVEDGYWRILGRSSVDIVKTGGEKVSALEVESTLLGHPSIAACAVVGVADPEWGERLCVAVVAVGEAPTLDALRAWAKERLAPYKVPALMRLVDDLPRNAMGKIVKPAVRELFESPEPSAARTGEAP